MKKRIFIRISAVVIAVLLLTSAVTVAYFTSNYISNRAPKMSQAASTSARAMCTIEAKTGRIVFEKNADAPLPMASTTKIVTAITVLENCKNLDEVVEIDLRAIGIEGTSIYIQKGEKLTVRELLLGLMLRSGNDCAAALALHISPPKDKTSKKGMFDAFCERMHETATRAGATNSGFRNPHGLDEEGHFTTAKDLALISAYAMKNPNFAEIVATKDAKISGVEYPRAIANKNRLLRSMPDCVGIKTGFTKKAGRCYVGAIERDGMTVISVVLNCGPMFEEAADLMEQVTEQFDMKRILTKDEFIYCNCHPEKPVGIATENFFYLLQDGENVEITCEDDTINISFEGKKIHSTSYNKL